MWSFLQFSQTLSNMNSLASYVDGGESSTEGDFRQRYLTALNCVQRRRFPFIAPSHDFFVAFHFDDEPLKDLMSHFLDSDELPKEEATVAAERGSICAGIVAGMQLLQQFDSETSRLVKALIGCLVVLRVPSFGGASIGDTLGAVWLSPGTFWDPTLYAESLLHETIHQALFLDEMVRGVYTVNQTVMNADDALVTSAIRRVARPFDQSFHAAWVAAFLMHFYRSIGFAEKAAEFYPPLLVTLAGLKEKAPRFLTSHGLDLLSDLEELVRYSNARLLLA